MRCPKCRKGQLVQQLSVFVECPLGQKSLNKKAIASSKVKIMGAGWDRATIYCSAGCGNFTRLPGK